MATREFDTWHTRAPNDVSLVIVTILTVKFGISDLCRIHSLFVYFGSADHSFLEVYGAGTGPPGLVIIEDHLIHQNHQLREILPSLQHKVSRVAGHWHEHIRALTRLKVTWIKLFKFRPKNDKKAFAKRKVYKQKINWFIIKLTATSLKRWQTYSHWLHTRNIYLLTPGGAPAEEALGAVVALF